MISPCLKTVFKDARFVRPAVDPRLTYFTPNHSNGHLRGFPYVAIGAFVGILGWELWCGPIRNLHVCPVNIFAPAVFAQVLGVHIGVHRLLDGSKFPTDDFEDAVGIVQAVDAAFKEDQSLAGYCPAAWHALSEWL